MTTLDMIEVFFEGIGIMTFGWFLFFLVGWLINWFKFKRQKKMLDSIVKKSKHKCKDPIDEFWETIYENKH